MVIARRNDAGRARLGLAISRRRAPRAVDRNRIKRLIRESFRTEVLAASPHPDPDIAPLRVDYCADYVVLARSATRHVDNARLFNSLSRHWQALARILKESPAHG